jgi:hypothetical protein
MHDCSDHIHNDFKLENLNKETLNSKLNAPDKFSGFDDFMYFSYKYWPLIKTEPENISKAENTFIQLAKKFNKLNGLDAAQLTQEAGKYSTHMDNVTRLIIEDGDSHTATVTIGKYIKPFTIQDKFIRNFNKKLTTV